MDVQAAISKTYPRIKKPCKNGPMYNEKELELNKIKKGRRKKDRTPFFGLY